jgi:outer membrane protein assembly factor BamB
VVCDFDGKRCGLFYGELYLSAMDLTSGQQMWLCPSHTLHPTSDPIVSGNKVFVANMETRLMEMATGFPKTVWTNSELMPSTDTPVLIEGFVYSSHAGNLGFPSLAWDKYGAATVPIRCLEMATGKVMWESTQKMQFVSACATASKLILLELGGMLHIVEASPVEYREISSADVLGGANRPRRFAVPPVLCGGRIYCRNYAGDLVCIDVSK